MTRRTTTAAAAAVCLPIPWPFADSAVVVMLWVQECYQCYQASPEKGQICPNVYHFGGNSGAAIECGLQWAATDLPPQETQWQQLVRLSFSHSPSLSDVRLKMSCVWRFIPRYRRRTCSLSFCFLSGRLWCSGQFVYTELLHYATLPKIIQTTTELVCEYS